MAESVEYILALKDQFSDSIKAATQHVKGFENEVSNTQTLLSGLRNSIVAAFGVYELTQFAKSVVDVGAKFESAEMGLKTLLKSGEAAHEVFNNVKEDAQKTPFDFQSLLMANRALISAGDSAQEARADVLNLSNAIAASGGGNDELQRMVINMQQIKNTGHATALDIKQFAYAGINIYGLLAESTGKTKKEVQGMEVTYEVLADALKKAGMEGGMFAGGLANAMNTVQGKLSNLGDQMDLLKNDVFQALYPVIQLVINSVSELITWLRENGDVILSLVAAVGTAVAIWTLYNAAVKISVWYTGLSTTAIILNTLVTEGLTAAMTALNIAIMANPMAWLVAAIAAVVAIVVYCYQNFEAFRKIINATWEVIKGLGHAVWDSLIAPFKVLFYLTEAVGYALVGNFTAAKQAMANAGDAIVKPLKDVKDGIENAKEAYDKTKIATNPAEKLKDSKSGAKTGSALTPAANQSEKVTGSKQTIINVQIGKLVETIKIESKNIKEGANIAAEHVSKGLLAAVNQFQASIDT